MHQLFNTISCDIILDYLKQINLYNKIWFLTIFRKKILIYRYYNIWFLNRSYKEDIDLSLSLLQIVF
jgi:hypothetical protein